MAIKDLLPIKTHLFICNGGTCKLNGAEEGTAAIRRQIIEAGLSDEVHTTKTLCNGRCKDGPVIISMPDGLWFKQMLPEKAASFVNTYLLNGEIPAEHLLYKYGNNVIHNVEPALAADIKAEA